MSGLGEAGQRCCEAQDGGENGEGEEHEPQGIQRTRQPSRIGLWFFGLVGVCGPVVFGLDGVVVISVHPMTTSVQRREDGGTGTVAESVSEGDL